MSDKRTVFIQMDELWTEQELVDFMDAIEGAVPDDARVVSLPHDVSLLDEAAVENIADRLYDSLNGEKT
jgi:cystathionine beta-lyase family protein involved in aluminum resistance